MNKKRKGLVVKFNFKPRRIPCETCGVKVKEGFMLRHVRQVHEAVKLKAQEVAKTVAQQIIDQLRQEEAVSTVEVETAEYEEEGNSVDCQEKEDDDAVIQEYDGKYVGGIIFSGKTCILSNEGSFGSQWAKGSQ